MSADSTAIATRPMTVKIGGRTLTAWTSCEVGRDLADFCGSFRVEYLDEARSAGLLGDDADGAPEFAAIRDRDPVEILIQGRTVLKGWVDDVLLAADEHTARATITGRDVSGDLVDCSANPTGPGEYRNISLESLVGSLMQPFGISLDTQVATGAPFTLVALDHGDSVMSAVEKHSRQRGVLVTSDGVGGVVLTKAGATTASDTLRFPGNVRAMEARLSGRGRYSDTWVKGQFKSLLRPSKAPLDVTAAPLSAVPGSAPAAPKHAAIEAACTVRYGHCVDPAVTRYRPRAWMSATQSGGSVPAQKATNPPLDNQAQGLSPVGPAAPAYHASPRRPSRKATHPRADADPWTLQDQAAWRMRSSRANTTARVYTVPGLLNGNNDLWLPNQTVPVVDRYSGLDQTMLIGAVTWVAQGDRYETRISVVGLDAYDLTGDEDHSRTGARKSAHLTARSLLGRG